MKAKRDQKIAYDYDHTLTRSPDVLSCFVRCPDAKSYIMTGRPNSERDTIVSSLVEMGIDPDFFEAILCYPVEYRMAEFGHVLMANIAKWKAETCRDMGIDVIFEDNMGVVKPIAELSPKTLVMLLF